MLNENPILKLQTSLERFPCKLKQKIFFNENEYDKLYPSGFALARIFSAPKMHMFSSSDTFPKLRPLIPSIGFFSYNLVRFLCDLLSFVFPDDYSCKGTFLLHQRHIFFLSVYFIIKLMVQPWLLPWSYPC